MNGIEALSMMAQMVQQNQNCVLEVIIGENGTLAHLIPESLWDEEMEGDSEDD